MKYGEIPVTISCHIFSVSNKISCRQYEIKEGDMRPKTPPTRTEKSQKSKNSVERGSPKGPIGAASRANGARGGLFPSCKSLFSEWAIAG